MVQAILSGQKTTTRRIIKVDSELKFLGYSRDKLALFGKGCCIHKQIKVPYIPGDILYVRETWLAHSRGLNTLSFKYKADDTINDKVSFTKERFDKFYKFADQEKWQPSLFMPKEAARIFLKVTNVKVERLNEMIIADCLSEGIRAYTKDNKLYKYAVNEDQYTWRDMPHNPHKAFKDLWNSTVNRKDIEKYGWKANPYVFVIEFERCEKPDE